MEIQLKKLHQKPKQLTYISHLEVNSQQDSLFISGHSPKDPVCGLQFLLSPGPRPCPSHSPAPMCTFPSCHAQQVTQPPASRTPNYTDSSTSAQHIHPFIPLSPIFLVLISFPNPTTVVLQINGEGTMVLLLYKQCNRMVGHWYWLTSLYRVTLHSNIKKKFIFQKLKIGILNHSVHKPLKTMRKQRKSYALGDRVTSPAKLLSSKKLQNSSVRNLEQCSIWLT